VMLPMGLAKIVSDFSRRETGRNSANRTWLSDLRSALGAPGHGLLDAS
jgi:hypothetical protein